MLYNAAARKGILYNKIIYQKYGKKKTQTAVVESSETNLNDDEISYDEELEYLLFFRTCVIRRDKEILKIKMRRTIKLREKLIKRKSTDFPHMFPFYFIDPELVRHFYQFSLYI